MPNIKAKIAPSMLSSDFACLADEAKRMVEAGADYLHMDVMDGHFVPNLTLGAPIIKSLRKHSTAFLEPEKWVSDFAKAGADMFTFHIEATKDPISLLVEINKSGMKAGLAVKPNTPVDTIFPLLDPLYLDNAKQPHYKIDMILIMTVEPGFGGQKMMPSCLEKVRALRDRYPTADLDIQVDGGIGVENIEQVAASGANVIVSGTGVFGHNEGPKEAISIMRRFVDAVHVK